MQLGLELGEVSGRLEGAEHALDVERVELGVDIVHLATVRVGSQYPYDGAGHYAPSPQAARRAEPWGA